MGADPTSRPDAVVAVVASAGGVEALTSFVSGLPADFSAAVLVVLHIPARGPSVLPGILARAGALPAVHPADRDPLRRGVIYVAPPDRHLTVSDGVVRVLPGPRENGHRPSADALLRSVAEGFGTRSSGVVLSGTMDDGAAGLRAVRIFGGLAIVQDPSEAAFPGMPLAALEAAKTAVVSPVHEIGKRLCGWLRDLDYLSHQEVTSSMDDPPEAQPDGEVTGFTCPDCGGSLWRVDQYGVERYRCRVGHSFSKDGLMLGKQDALESALWAAIVALEEKADLARRVSRRLEKTGRTAQLDRYESDVVNAEEQLAYLRNMVAEVLATSPVVEEGGASA